MALQDPQCIETGDSDAETLVLGEGGTFVAGEHSTSHAGIKKIFRMDVAKLVMDVAKDNSSLLEEAGVESAWGDAMEVAELLHDNDATPDDNRPCVERALSQLLHEKMKSISRDIGKRARSLQRRAHLMQRLHHNAKKLVRTFREVARKKERKLALTYR